MMSKVLQSNKQEFANVIQHVPPHDLDLEKIVIGSLLLHKSSFEAVSSFLKPDNFYFPIHAKIYKCMLALKGESMPIDIITVSKKLRNSSGTDEIVNADYLVGLTQLVSAPDNIEHYARIILELSLRRNLTELLVKHTRDINNLEEDVFELIDIIQKDIFDFGNDHIQTSRLRTAQEIGINLIKELSVGNQNASGLTGVPSGYRDLDRITAGWQNTDLIIMAARPGVGKTAWVLSSIHHLIAGVPVPIDVAIFSLEMSGEQLMGRLYSIDTSIMAENIKRKNLNSTELRVITSSKVNSAHCYIDDTPGLTVAQFRSRVRRLVARYGVKIVFLDYLQLMRLDDSNKQGGGNREQEIAKISRTLKLVAKENNIPVIALSQLSRSVETRGGDKRPQLSDLRDSGSIEQDADIVTFLYRPEYYKIDQDENGNSTAGIAETIIAKHRNGSLGTVKVRFIGKYTKFIDEQDMVSSHRSWGKDDAGKRPEDKF